MMKRQSMITALALLVSGCTIMLQDGGVNAGFHPPLVNKYWHVQNYVMRDSTTHVCAISSGYNGLTVNITHPASGEEVLVQSNRMMQPGATLTVNAGGGSYEAYDTYFTPSASRALLESMEKGGRAYFEWSEFSGPAGRERSHIQNIVQLDDFPAQVKECRAALAHN